MVSSNLYVTHFEFLVSHACERFLLLLHGGAFVLLYFLAIEEWQRGMLYTYCLFSLLYNLRQHAWRINRRTVTALRHIADWEYMAYLRGGCCFIVHLTNQSVITDQFLHIRFQLLEKGGALAVTLLSDAVPEPEIRHLRLLLSKACQ